MKIKPGQVKEFKRFGRRAGALAKKSAALRREQIRFDTTLEKWARKHRISMRAHRVAHKAPTTTSSGHCKPKIREGKGLCVLTSEYRSSTGQLICFYRCFGIAENFPGSFDKDW